MPPERNPGTDARPALGVSEALAGSVQPATFDAFFEMHHARLFATLCLIAESRAEAEDLMQDAFVKILERWERVRTHADPIGYLYRTSFNLLRNRRRNTVRAARRALAPSVEADPYVQLDHQDELARALRELTVRQRAAVVLTDLLDYPSSEAAAMLGIRPATVRVLASQGRARLRECLEIHDD